LVTKHFLVAVDREACALYKKQLDKILPPEYSEVVYTKNNEKDTKLMREYWFEEKEERQIRKNFIKAAEDPKILIVTEKLLTGFDARFFTRCISTNNAGSHPPAGNRAGEPSYENEAAEMVKPHGFVLDFVGIFDKIGKSASVR